MKKPINHFSIVLNSDPIKISSTISKGRVRIFYKGANRNFGRKDRKKYAG